MLYQKCFQNVFFGFTREKISEMKTRVWSQTRLVCTVLLHIYSSVESYLRFKSLGSLFSKIGRN